MTYLEQALAKLKDQAKLTGKAKIVAPAVAEALTNFCNQDGEFAQAVAQGGSFADCLAAVVKGVGGSISDLECYRRAVQFYFPTADIRMELHIDLAPHAQEANHTTDKPTTAEPTSSGGIVLNFSDFF